MFKGTLGELFVQIRLLEYGVQAARPLRDTGNDLIAIRGKVIKCIQVKTGNDPKKPKPQKIYDLMAIVKLKEKNGSVLNNESKISIGHKNDERKNYRELTQELVDKIWKNGKS